MTIVDEPTRQRHAIVPKGPHGIRDPRIVYTACGKAMARRGPHQRPPGHFDAFPDCTCQQPVTNCCA